MISWINGLRATLRLLVMCNRENRQVIWYSYFEDDILGLGGNAYSFYRGTNEVILHCSCAIIKMIRWKVIKL